MAAPPPQQAGREGGGQAAVNRRARVVSTVARTPSRTPRPLVSPFGAIRGGGEAPCPWPRQRVEAAAATKMRLVVRGPRGPWWPVAQVKHGPSGGAFRGSVNYRNSRLQRSLSCKRQPSGSSCLREPTPSWCRTPKSLFIGHPSTSDVVLISMGTSFSRAVHMKNVSTALK